MVTALTLSSENALDKAGLCCSRSSHRCISMTATEYKRKRSLCGSDRSARSAALCASDFVLTTGESEWMRESNLRSGSFLKGSRHWPLGHDHVGNTVIPADLIPASSRSIVSFAPNTLGRLVNPSAAIAQAPHAQIAAVIPTNLPKALPSARDHDRWSGSCGVHRAATSSIFRARSVGVRIPFWNRMLAKAAIQRS